MWQPYFFYIHLFTIFVGLVRDIVAQFLIFARFSRGISKCGLY